MIRAVILANGEPPPPELLRRLAAEAALFVCADGGADVARACGLTPAAVIGDLDSIDPETLAFYRREAGVEVIEDRDTERTDLEKALEYVLRRQGSAPGRFGEVTLLGACGGRLDHVVGHLSLMRKYLERARLVLEDASVRAYLVRGEGSLAEPPGTVVSFFAPGRPARAVTTWNLRYPLQGRDVEMGVQDSISNVVERNPAGVRMAEGELLIVCVKRA